MTGDFDLKRGPPVLRRAVRLTRLVSIAATAICAALAWMIEQP
jgi:hypothetical protein